MKDLTEKKKNRILYSILINKLNFFFTYKIINLIFFKNCNLFFNFKKFYYNFNFQLLYSFKFKYIWLESINDFNKFYFYENTDFFCFNFYLKKKIKNNFILNHILNFKNKNILYKDVKELKNEKLNFINNFKNNDVDYEFIDFYNSKKEFDIKHFEFYEKKLFFFKKNRIFLKHFLNLKNKIKKFINKYLKKLIKTNNNDFFNFFEYSIVNVLLNCHFFLNKKDIIFFLKNKYIFVNNKNITNLNHRLKKNDIINISYNKYIYFIYKNYLENINLYLNKQNNFNKFINKENKIERDIKYMRKSNLFNNDVPKNFEVDYLSMSLILIYNSEFVEKNYNLNLKFLNFFSRRLYNWKYII